MIVAITVLDRLYMNSENFNPSTTLLYLLGLLLAVDLESYRFFSFDPVHTPSDASRVDDHHLMRYSNE